jgi:V-type H+-transporting ATPase subunit F
MILTDTAVSEIEDTFKRFIKRDDIDIILINQNVSNEIIKKYIYNYTETG